ncbi:hypothetical protein CHS0354_015649 [Potamilus streckersoni]|uniref:C1q domain-containing protein n=1 Tax=Potamilus streckersoni TaxID=2493646 RepID=A0AAE0SEB4_9BIVA|nr:hypothetical protein CHS0354_015649 [Potamilus streckersoni]
MKHYQHVFATDKTCLEHGEVGEDLLNVVKEMTLKIKILEERVSQALKLEAKVSRMEELESRVAEQGKLIEQLMDQVKRSEATDWRETNPNADFVHENMTSTPIVKNENKVKAVSSPSRGIRRDVIPKHVAFTAYLDHSISGIVSGMIIRLPATLLNDGNAYNIHTGVFTVPFDGTYLFTFSIVRLNEDQIVAKLVVDNTGTVDAIADPEKYGFEHQGTNAAILRLQQGQSVWLEAYHVNAADGIIFDLPNERFSTFAGVLLY